MPLFRPGFCLVLGFSFEKQRLICCNCGDKSFYSDPGSLFLISSTVSISPLESSSWTPFVIHLIHTYNFRLRDYSFLLVSFDSLAGKAFSARSIKLCLVDNQQSSGITVAWLRISGITVAWLRIVLIRSRIANITYSINRICHTSRKIGRSSHQVVSDFRFPVRYYPSFFPLDSFRVTVLDSTKTLQKNITVLDPF